MLALAPCSAIYDLKYPCRTMAPVLAEDDMHSFFVGTMMMGRVGRSTCAAGWDVVVGQN